MLNLLRLTRRLQLLLVDARRIFRRLRRLVLRVFELSLRQLPRSFLNVCIWRMPLGDRSSPLRRTARSAARRSAGSTTSRWSAILRCAAAAAAAKLRFHRAT